MQHVFIQIISEANRFKLDYYIVTLRFISASYLIMLHIELMNVFHHDFISIFKKS